MFKVARLACPECGSDADTGWKDAEDIDYMSIELPDELPPDEVLFGRRRKPLWWMIAALAALAAMVVFALW